MLPGVTLDDRDREEATMALLMLLTLVLESTHVDCLVGFLGDLSWDALFGFLSTLRNRSSDWFLGRDLLLLRRISSIFGAEFALFIAMLEEEEEGGGGEED